MKKLQILLSVLIIFTCSTSLFSQKISLGIKGGLNFSNMLEESDYGDWSDNYSFIPGYNIGIYAEAEASPGLIGEGGLSLSTFGYKIDTEGTAGSVYGEFKTSYLLIPLKAKTVHELGPVSFFGGGGVYAGYGLSGTLDLDITLNGTTTSTNEEISWGNDPDENDMVRLDYGVVASAGAMFKGVILEFSYYHGLANISSDAGNNYIMNNRAFHIALGYMIAFN